VISFSNIGDFKKIWNHPKIFFLVHPLLMVKVRALEILKLRTTRKNPTKDRPTPPSLHPRLKEEKKTETNPGGFEKIKSVKKAQLDEAT